MATRVSDTYYFRRKGNGGGGGGTVEPIQPSDGMKPNTVYSYGEINEDTVFSIAEGKEGEFNHYFWTFETGDEVPDITWPDSIRLWKDNTEPTIEAHKHYEISIYDGVALYVVIDCPDTTLSKPLTFDITADGNIIWKSAGYAEPLTIEYKKNDGDWTEITSSLNGEIIPVEAGDTVQFRGDNAIYEDSTFTGSTCGFEVSGNIMSLVDSVDYPTATELESSGDESWSGNFFGLFSECSGLTDASGLILPATKITAGCYNCMFSECANLVHAPKILPATDLSEAPSCYGEMFEVCTSLVDSPILPATVLSEYCYFDMFADCSSLVDGPELPATTLESECYDGMFWGCTSLRSITCNALTFANMSTKSWIYGVSSPTGTFKKNEAADWSSLTGNNGIPAGWTVENI